jgi:hypothetical protein
MSLSGLAEDAIDEFLSLENEGTGVDSATALRFARNDRDSVSHMLDWIPGLRGVNGCSGKWFGQSVTPALSLNSLRRMAMAKKW